MTVPLVVDASVFIKLFLPEHDSALATKRLLEADELHAPDLLWPECVNILRKQVRRRGIAADEALFAINSFRAFRIRIHESTSLMHAAFHVAMETNQPPTTAFI